MGTSKKSGYLLKLTLVATLGGLLFGYDTGVISGTVGSLDSFFVQPKGLSETAANAFKGFLVASALIGCIIGGIFGGLVSKKLGRKKGLILAAILFLISALGSAMPEMGLAPIGELDHTFSTIFIIYRIIGGIGVGLASMLSPLYIAEIAPADSRGRLVSFNQLAIVGGFMIVYFVNYFISKGGGSDAWLNEVGWRWMFASEVIPAGLFLGLLFFVPDTPRSLMLKNKPEEALDVSKEQAKVIGLAQVEIDVTADYFDYNAGWARRIEGEIIQSDREKEHIYLHKVPIGVAVGICPWNFPFFVMARKVAASLITGNTCVIKPSSEAPNTIMEFADFIQKIDLPKGVLNFVCGAGRTVGNALSKSPITGIISLTGSVGAGQQIISAAAENITKVSLELGGKAPAIVCADANMDLAVNSIVSSKVIFSGQVCNCAERVYVEDSIYDEFVEKITKKNE